MRLKNLEAEGDLRGKGWLALDDRLTRKTGKAMEAVAIFRHHCQNRHALAHNVVTAIFVRRDGSCHPLHLRVYLKEECCKKNGFHDHYRQTGGIG